MRCRENVKKTSKIIIKYSTFGGFFNRKIVSVSIIYGKNNIFTSVLFFQVCLLLALCAAVKAGYIGYTNYGGYKVYPAYFVRGHSGYTGGLHGEYYNVIGHIYLSISHVNFFLLIVNKHVFDYIS